MPAVRTNQPHSAATPLDSPQKQRAVLTDAQKAYLVAAALDAAQKHLDFDQLSSALGISKSQLRQQFLPNRANLRRSIENLFK